MNEILIIFLYGCLVQNLVSFPLGPSLDDLKTKRCPADMPVLCIPYGSCCKFSQFCHEGLCETCFPDDVKNDQLLQWCRDIGMSSASAMRSHSCRFACRDRFSEEQLAKVIHINVTDTNDDIDQPASGQSSETRSDSHVVADVVLKAVIVASMIVIIILLVKICKRMAINSGGQSLKATSTENSLNGTSSGVISQKEKAEPNVSKQKPPISEAKPDELKRKEDTNGPLQVDFTRSEKSNITFDNISLEASSSDLNIKKKDRQDEDENDYKENDELLPKSSLVSKGKKNTGNRIGEDANICKSKELDTSYVNPVSQSELLAESGENINGTNQDACQCGGACSGLCNHQTNNTGFSAESIIKESRWEDKSGTDSLSNESESLDAAGLYEGNSPVELNDKKGAKSKS